MICIFVTGGTFDKTYDEIRGTLTFGEAHLPAMLHLGRSRVDVTVRTLMMIDSLDMTDRDRQAIVRAGQHFKWDRVRKNRETGVFEFTDCQFSLGE